MLQKNTLKTIIPCALALTMLTACSSGGHTHTAAGLWDRSATEHWQLCECGETLNTGEHSLDDSWTCTVCGSEVLDWGDSIDVWDWNEYGEMVRSTSYDADGNVLSESRYEYEYDANGGKLRAKCYQDGVLTEESEYEPGTDGEGRILKLTSYWEDGSWFTNDYDEDGNVTALIEYDANGNMIYQDYSEYAYNTNGDCYLAGGTIIEEDGTKYIAEYDEYEAIISRIKYDSDGTLVYEERYEREYNADGNPLWEKTYENGVLIREIVAYVEETSDDFWMRYPETIIDYEEDGSKTVSEYGQNGTLTSETTYAADGTKTVIEYDENGEVVSETNQ